MCKKYLFAVMFAAAVLGGCNKRSGIASYPVTGTVTYKGKPVVGATISYVSTNPDGLKPGATTNSDGQFSLTTYISPNEVLKGAPAGDYGVVIVKQVTKAAPAEDIDMANATMEQRMQSMQKQWASQQERSPDGKSPPKPKSEIPEKYASVETSELKQTIVSGPNDPVEFKLTDD